MQGGDVRVLCSGDCAIFLQLKSKWDEFIFTKGCIPALEGWLPRNIYIVAGVFIAISLLQVCPAVPRGCTCSVDPDSTGGKVVVTRGQ